MSEKPHVKCVKCGKPYSSFAHTCVEFADQVYFEGGEPKESVPACDQGSKIPTAAEIAATHGGVKATWYQAMEDELSRVTKERDRLRELADSRLKGWGEMHDERNELRAELDEARDHIKDLQVRRACIQCFVPHTYGDAILENWLQHGEIEGYEWDNRTSEENIVWMTKRLLAELEKVKEDRDNLRGTTYQLDYVSEKARHADTKSKLLAAEAALREAREIIKGWNQLALKLSRGEFSQEAANKLDEQTAKFWAEPVSTELLDRVRDQVSNILKDEHCAGKARLMTTELLRMLGGEPS